MCYGTKITDFSPLAGMPLKALIANNMAIADLRPLADMPLDTLWIQRTSVADLSPLLRCTDLIC